MQKNIKIIIGIASLALIGLAVGWVLTGLSLTKTKAERDVALKERNAARLSEGQGWLFTAQQAAGRFPDSLFFAAKAIGFRGQGGNDETSTIPLIRESEHPTEFGNVQEWLDSQEAFRPIWSGDLGSPISDLAVSVQGRYLFATCEKSAKRWDFSKDNSASNLDGAAAIAANPDGKSFAAAGSATTIFGEDGSEIKQYKESSSVVAYNLLGDTLAVARPDGAVTLLGDKSISLSKSIGKVSHLAFSPDDATLAVVIPEVGIRLWFYHEQTSHQAWSEHKGDVSAVAYQPQAESGLLAIGNADGSIEIRQIFDAKHIGKIDNSTFHKGSVTCLSYATDGKRLVSGGTDGLIHLWDTQSDTPSLIGKLSGHVGEVSDVAFLPGGELVASSGLDGTVKIWDVRMGIKPANLYTYIKEGWYEFDANTRGVVWKDGSGFIDLPGETLIGAWQSGEQATLSEALLASGDIAAAGLISSDLGPIQKALKAGVDSAVKNRSWHLARLRSHQMEQLGLDTKAIKKPFNNGKDFINGQGAGMIWCKPGKFFMGESDGPDFAMKHEVRLSKGFWLGKHEVTQAIWQTVMGTNPSVHRDAGLHPPAENFNLNEATDFCRKLTGLERAKGAIPAGWEYAIPTEAQWEYACRAGKTTTWAFGDKEGQLHKNGNFDDKNGKFSDDSDPTQDDGHKYTAPVGSYAANPWGFHDMHGNVFEWCRDAMDPTNPDYPDEPVTDPLSTKGSLQAIRGGSYDATAAECRSAYRDATSPLVPSQKLGLRVALVPVKN